MDDRFLSLDYRYAYVSSRDPNAPPDTKRPGGHVRLPTGSNVLDVRSGEITQCSVEPSQSLQEGMFVPRKNAKGEGDGYVMAIASNYESMSSDLVIADAQRLDQGVIATVKLPFRLRSGTHTNWYPRSALPPVKDELT